MTDSDSKMDVERFIHEMPKAELHVHLEGTLEPHMVRMLASRNQLSLPESLKAMEREDGGYAFHDLTSFLAIYYPAMAVLQTSQDFCDLTYAYLMKCREQHVLHTEMFFDPQAHTGRGVPFPTVINGIWQAVVKGRAELGVSASLIMCFLRDMSPEFAMATLMEALPYKDRIIGVGLDSDERDNPPLKFKKVFERAKAEGFLLTAHCDIDQADSIEHIRQCVLQLGVNRIDHGTNIVEDETLMEIVRSKGIGLTCCPISNSVVTKDFKGGEIKTLLGRGVKVTVNSDDPAYFRGYVCENLVKMAKEGNMSLAELVQLQQNAFRIAWISDRRRDLYLERLESYASSAGVNSLNGRTHETRILDRK